MKRVKTQELQRAAQKLITGQAPAPAWDAGSLECLGLLFVDVSVDSRGVFISLDSESAVFSIFGNPGVLHQSSLNQTVTW